MSTPPPLNPKSTALFLDFDGTLAPLQSEPATVFLAPGQPDILLKLATAMDHALAIISGRDILDLALRVPSELLRIGGHGLDIAGPGALPARTSGEAPGPLATAFTQIAAKFENVWVEPKGRVLAVHYRENPDAGAALDDALTIAAAHYPDYNLQPGKMVIEAKPAAANKGAALRATMQSEPFATRFPILIGDDKTDEDAMTAARELGGYGVKVGEGDTVAPWRLTNTTDVWQWLEDAL